MLERGRPWILHFMAILKQNLVNFEVTRLAETIGEANLNVLEMILQFRPPESHRNVFLLWMQVLLT